MYLIMHTRGGIMSHIKFILALEQVEVDHIPYDQITLIWDEPIDHDRAMALARDWLCDDCHSALKQRLGITNLGEASLTLEPIS